MNMNTNETTIDNNNEKMLAFSVNAFYDIYKTYEKYASFMNNGNTSMINLIDELKMFAKDIGIVKTTAARRALLDEFDILLNAICHRFKAILAIMNEYGHKMVVYRNKLPLPKTEINKILKQLNFVDYDESETTAGNLCDQRQIEQNFFEMTNKKMNEMPRDVEKSCVEDAKSHGAEVADSSKNIKQILDECGLQDMDDPSYGYGCSFCSEEEIHNACKDEDSEKNNEADEMMTTEEFLKEAEKSVEASVEEKHEDEDSSKNKKANASKKTSTRKRRTKKNEKKDSK